jgi:hypothetical protein
MKISERTVKRLGKIITGDKGISPYRGGPKLVSFFEKDSGGTLLLRTGLFHLATTRMTPKNDTKFATKAVATPATDMIGPAGGGPTARARLNSIPLSAEAAARSSLGTNSREDCTPGRRFERVSRRERKCEHQEYPWRHHSCDGQDG